MPKRTRDHQTWLVEKLTDPERASSYLNTAHEDSPQMFLEAVKDVAQAHQMTAVAKKAGVTRESLYKALSTTGNPTFETFVSVLDALNLDFNIVPKVFGAVESAPPIGGEGELTLVPSSRVGISPFKMGALQPSIGKVYGYPSLVTPLAGGCPFPNSAIGVITVGLYEPQRSTGLSIAANLGAQTPADIPAFIISATEKATEQGANFKVPYGRA